ncbi:hypothetical protein EX895_000694 [Sporisorium graminicola]|uniref:DUF4203 domain-containing protein n=1 Tax=Sporisorium graminicola TaxID=280036 RepID=A0A4U7L1R6_9BASI|nr:hypothetical protein EX895_000694 [Sporisorium graminicola]TKY90696.1 hypothetical protein EX895_000694 [Sporisorium graminicola]
MVPRRPLPNLYIRDFDPDSTFQGHDSEAIANALTTHSQKMADIAKEITASSSGLGTASYQGHDSSDIAKAVQSYVVSHQDTPWSQKFTQPSDILAVTSSPSADFAASVLAADSMSSIGTAPGLAPVFSLSGLIHDQYWMSIILCIAWIVSGLFLLFFGWASFFWGCSLGNKRKRIDEKVTKASRLSPLFAGPPLAGGVGGAVVGFLFFSFLASVVTASICVAEIKSVSSTWYFVIWLLPGLLGAFLAGHWPLFARTFTGLLSGASLTLIITAMFGIHTLIIRAIIVAVCTALITAPLLIPRRNMIHFHMLNICTSIIGMVTFLDGVALFAPSRASSDAWIELWVLLFAGDNTSSEMSATKKWGSSVFKGFIAASVLGTLVGFVFEFLFHKHAAEDPDMEWNNYLGTYTQRLENQDTTDLNDRAGSFEPAPNAWQKLSRAFASSGGPASYGNVSTSNDLEKSPLTDLPGQKARQHAHRTRSSKARKAPAKFAALNKGHKGLDLADSDSDGTTDYDSDSSLRKSSPSSKAVSAKSLLSKADADELADQLKPLTASGDVKLDKSAATLLPRPPSYRTNSSKSGSGSTASGLSGTTANSSDNPAPADVRPTAQRTGTMSPPPSFSASGSPATSPLVPSFPATPSLVNAITRIQAAQAQAKAWYETQQGQRSTSPNHPSSQLEPGKPTTKIAIQPSSNKSTDASSTRAADPSAATDTNSFQSWWGKEVKRDSPPS